MQILCPRGPFPFTLVAPTKVQCLHLRFSWDLSKLHVFISSSGPFFNLIARVFRRPSQDHTQMILKQLL